MKRDLSSASPSANLAGTAKGNVVIKPMILLVLMTSGLNLNSPEPAKASSMIIEDGGTQPEQKPARPKEMKARILANGKALVPDGAPPAVQQAIRAGNKIVGKPYVYGGGHGSFSASGYDCSGTVSYALHGGKLISSPMASGDLMSWGSRGNGRWITVYANGGHAFMQIAGIRLDTSRAGDPAGGKGPRWRRLLRSTAGFSPRHPQGL